MLSLDSLKEIHFADCDPAFFPDDEEDPDELRVLLDEFEQLIDFAEFKADDLYEQRKNVRTEELRHLIARAHILIEKEQEDL